MSLDYMITLLHVFRDFVILIVTSNVEHQVRDPCADGPVSHGGVDQPVEVVLHSPSVG